MVLWKSKQKQQKQKHTSALDIPLTEYDPRTALPKSIFIGDQQTPPLVWVHEARDHLVLLSAFHQYRASSPDTYPARCLSAARAYAYWAQHTFSPKEPLTPEQLPSLDILMAWHAHMLNPKTFDVDVNGVYASLQGLAFPLSLAVSYMGRAIPWCHTNHMTGSSNRKRNPSIPYRPHSGPDFSAQSHQMVTRRHLRSHSTAEQVCGKHAQNSMA
ncbi:hypothetical protein, variant [Cryptococcus amylolentus CBS 6039]|uniref:Uncharacterized protein n=1 Tax=Cryptococcus amylolentus CBS 6039 TaxID=1295533 RepID=A0A1E3HAB0_9TREE|nr:hypothetical protein, variant [Cryptococcus amylolentus CBS 6039]ODN73278.1 hypothetical protein, variant [Cryptococcus amylolentus CBS 6039]